MSIKLKDTIYDIINNADKLDSKHASEFAVSGHTHNYASTVMVGTTAYTCTSNNIIIPAYPTALKCPNSLTIQGNGTSLDSYDGSAAKTINITPASIGAAASHSHPYLSTSGGTLTGAVSFQTGTQTALVNARYDGTNYTNILWHKHGDSSGAGSTVIFGSPQWENVILETKANQNCAYRQTSGTKYKIWDEGNDGSGSGLDADLLDGVHLMGKGGNSGVMRSWARGTYTTSKQYFGNGNVVVIDPKPSDDNSLWANTTIFSVGDMEIRSHQLAFGYNEDKILYRRVDDGPRYNSWRTLAFTDSKVSSAGYADNSGQLGGYGTGSFYMAARGSLNKDTLSTFTQRSSGGYLINGYSGYSGLLISLQGNGGSCSSIEFIAPHYDISTGGLQVRYTIDSQWYGTTKSICFTDHTHSGYAASSHTHTKSQITDFSHTHSYLPLSGGTITGPLTFANGTWNVVGDDAAIGDVNQAGILGLKSINNNLPGISFFNSSGTHIGTLLSDAGTLKWSGTAISLSGHTHNYAGSDKSGGSAYNLYAHGGSPGSHNNVNATWYTMSSTVSGNAGYAGTNAGFPVNDNANGLLWLGCHSGPYGGQLGVSSNGRLYYRYITNNSFPTTANGGSWNRIAWTSDIPSIPSINAGILGSLTNTGTVGWASKTYGIWFRNHYSGHGLGPYRNVLTCCTSGEGFELNSYWCVNPGDPISYNNLYYRVKRDAASEWGSYVRIIDSGNIGSQSVNYANSSGNSSKWGGYSIVVGSTGTDSNTFYITV